MQRVLFVLLVVAGLVAVWWFGFREADAPAPADDGEWKGTPPFVSPIDFNELAEKGSSPEGEDGPALEAKGAEAKDEPAEAPVALPEGGMSLFGHVLAEGRRPVAGAALSVTMSYALPHEVRGRSDAAGAYRLVGVSHAEDWGYGLVVARKDGKVGHGTVWLMSKAPDEVKVHDIVLGDAHRLRCVAKLEDGTPAEGATVHVEVRSAMRSLVLRSATADANGDVTFEDLPKGSYRVLASKDGLGRGVVATSLPARGEAPVVVTLGAERELTAVVVDKDTQEPIEGARILLDEHIKGAGGHGSIQAWQPPTAELRTDAEGRCRIPGLGATDGVQVNAEAEGYPKRGGWRTVSSHPLSNTEVRIELRKLRTVRWPLAADNPHAPPDGTVLEILATRGAVARGGLPPTARIEGKEIVAEGCSPDLFHATAVAPSGVYGRLFINRDEGSQREVTFFKPRNVTVRVTRGDGTPAEGAYVSARNQGNNVIVDPIRLDETGVVELSVRYEHLVDFFVNEDATPYAGRAIGSLDFRKETGGTIEGTLPAVRRVELHVTINGKPALPDTYGFFRTSAVHEDPVKGLLVFELPGDPSKPQKAQFTAAGFLPQTVEIPAIEGDGPARVDVRLSQGGTVLLRIKPPSDGTMQVNVVEQGVTPRGIPMGPGRPVVEALGSEGGWTLQRIGPLSAGTYEAVDGLSKARSEPVEVKLGAESVVSIDLSKVGVLKGRVEAPDGIAVSGARVRIHEEGVKDSPFTRMQGAWVRQDGTFEIRVPGDREVELRVSHGLLVAAAEGGTATVKEPRDDVVLRLVAGATATFTIDGLPDGLPSHPGQSSVRVYLYKDEPRGPATHTLQAQKDGDGFKISGFEPGTWHVVVDVRKRALVVLGKRTLGKASDLGVIAPQPGATLIIRVKVKEGQDPPRIYANAYRSEGIPHSRFINSRGELEVRVPGLSAGTYKVRAMSMAGFGSSGTNRGASIDETITCDGSTDIVRELDLR